MWGSLPQKLEKLGRVLQNWAINLRKTWRKKKSELVAHLQSLNDDDPDEEKLSEITDVKLALNLEVDKEEIYWE